MSTGVQDSVYSLYVFGHSGILRVNPAEPFGKPYSGVRVNRVTDDTGQIASNDYVKEMVMRMELLGLQKSQMDAEKPSAMLQHAENALSSIEYRLDQLKDLAVESADITTTDRETIQREADDHVYAIDRIARNTKYNDRRLINGDLAEGIGSGIRDQSGNEILIKLQSARAARLGTVSGPTSINEVHDEGFADMNTRLGAQRALSIIEYAIEDVRTLKNDIDAYQVLFSTNAENIESEKKKLDRGELVMSDEELAYRWAAFNSGQIYNHSGNEIKIQEILLPDSMLSLLG